MKILVVDDDPIATELICAILEPDSHQLVTAANVIEAFTCLEQHADIELIISDMNMPLISGIEFFRELQEQGSTRPFILLSSTEPEKLLAMEPALLYHLAKDFNIDQSLPGLIKQVLTRK